MGLFNSVYVKCPNCGKNVEFQAKPGDDSCEAYILGQDLIPLKVIAMIDDNCQQCYSCDRMVRVRPSCTPSLLVE